MYKLLTFPGSDDNGNPLVQAINPSSGLVKVATGDLMPKVSSFINGLSPASDKVYVLVNALGAGEYYGSNINGDYFEESELNPTDPEADTGFTTFADAGIYRHHKNKDKEKSMGRVILSCYNPVMHRVELVLEIDRAKAAQEGHAGLIDSLDNGGNPAVSMGCRVKYDVCSICGNKSKTRADYCIHTKNMMGKILPDGRKVFVYNPKPKFFDLSFVVIGADRTSFAMMKVASAQGVISSAELAEQHNLSDSYEQHQKLASRNKFAAIVKRVPALSAKISPRVFSKEPDLPGPLLDRMAQTHPVRKILTSTASSGIMLKPKEYQRVILVSMGKKPMADSLDRRGITFSPGMGSDRSLVLGRKADFSSSLRDMLIPFLSQRSMFEPMMTKRLTIIIRKKPEVSHVKMASVETPLLNKIADGYNGYRQQLIENINSIVNDITQRDQRLLLSLNESRFEDMMSGRGHTKQASRLDAALLGILPLAYLYGAHVNREEASTGKSPGPLDKFIEQHPIIASSVLMGLARLGSGLLRSGNVEGQLEGLLGRL